MMKRNICLFLFSILILCGCSEKSKSQIIDSLKSSATTEKKNEYDEISQRIAKRAEIAQKFCAENNFNENYCILIDMSIHSGKNRMFVYNFKDKTIERRSLFAHGIGKMTEKVRSQHQNSAMRREVY